MASSFTHCRMILTVLTDKTSIYTILQACMHNLTMHTLPHHFNLVCCVSSDAMKHTHVYTQTYTDIHTHNICGRLKHMLKLKLL